MRDIAVGLDEVAGSNRLMRVLRRIERTFNSVTCMIMNGGHELYIIRHEGQPRLFQRCLLCGHETKGWNINQRR